jgi:hypothetical protein
MSPLDALHAMDDGALIANDQILMTFLSICVFHERFYLGKTAQNLPDFCITRIRTPAATHEDRSPQDFSPSPKYRTLSEDTVLRKR